MEISPFFIMGIWSFLIVFLILLIYNEVQKNIEEIRF
jgi:hypothetical protein